MKKLISLILILCMACLLIPAMAEDDVTGDWYYAGMGDAVHFVFNADGTAKLITDMMGQQSEEDGTWSLDGSAMTITFSRSGRRPHGGCRRERGSLPRHLESFRDVFDERPGPG